LPSRPATGPVPPASTPAFTRFIAGVQILGTVLGIPLGLASGYSIYRANFSPEAKCGALRANIISMLDKNADASTLRLLVRRDVDTFEHSCGSVDPDAVAAFKTLLAKPTAVAAAPKAVKSVKEAKAVRPAKVEMKVESRVEKKADKKVAHAAPAEHAAHARQEAARHEGVRVARVDEKAARAKADGNWLAAVRRALVEHAPVRHAQAAEAPVQPTPAPVAPPMVQPMVRSMGTLPAPAQAQAAPALPPATAVVDVPGNPASKNDESHPVPPALIPDVGAQPAK
jgi:hypothetical protein